jgi:hypothetical protein
VKAGRYIVREVGNKVKHEMMSEVRGDKGREG